MSQKRLFKASARIAIEDDEQRLPVRKIRTLARNPKLECNSGATFRIGDTVRLTRLGAEDGARVIDINPTTGFVRVSVLGLKSDQYWVHPHRLSPWRESRTIPKS